MEEVHAWLRRVDGQKLTHPAPSRYSATKMRFRHGIKHIFIAFCFYLVAIVGYIDYRDGIRAPASSLYLLPISLATWFGSLSRIRDGRSQHSL
jgi:hypothetical protein